MPVGDDMKDSTKAIRFLQTLHVPEGPLAGNPLKLAPFQKRFVKGALDPAADAEAGERREFAARTSRENYGDPESS